MAAATGAAVTLKGFLRTDVPLPYLRRGFWLLAGPQMLITATQAGWDVETTHTG